MSETIEEGEPIEETESLPEEEEEEEKAPIPEVKAEEPLGITDEEIAKIRRLLISVTGGNPDTEQTITDFMDMKSPVEGSNLPNRRDVQLEVYLDICGKFLFPEIPDDPFTVLRDSIALTFKAKGGEKAKQFVEMVRNQPDLSKIASMPEEVQRSTLDRVLRRGKE